jgi:NTE family protein
MTKRKLAFVLGGGGARGALQAGALRALLEAGIQPDLLVGTSIGAVNAVFLAMRGFSLPALDQLNAAWYAAAKADLFPTSTTWLTLRVFFNRVHVYPYQGLKDFFISQGIGSDLRFADLPHFPVILVSADLNSHQPVYHGSDPKESVLDALLASTALPPWIHPIESDGRFLMDGGAVSNLPIEPAIAHGATEVIAVGLSNPDEIDPNTHGFGPFWTKYLNTVEARQISLELQLAHARNVPAHLVTFKTDVPVPPWDFSRTHFLLGEGYRQMKAALASGKIPLGRRAESWFATLRRLIPSWGKTGPRL